MEPSPLEVRRTAVSSRALVALAAMMGPAPLSCARAGRGASPSGGGGAPATSIEAEGVWEGLRVRTVGERTHPRQVVVLLHGWGAPGADLVPLGQVLQAPGRLFVFPEGPLVSPGGGRAWWHIDMARLIAARQGPDAGDLRRETPAGLSAARAQVTALLGEVARRTGLPARAVVLGGFSQGAMLSTDVALAAPEAVGGLVILSGSIVSEDAWTERLRSPGRAPWPIFMSHGRGDPVLPFSISAALLALLKGAHRDVTWVPFAGGHEIPGAVLSQLQAFLVRHDPAAPAAL